MSQPNFIDCIRTCRKEKNMGFEEAKRFVIEVFKRKGWEIPKSMENSK